MGANRLTNRTMGAIKNWRKSQLFEFTFYSVQAVIGRGREDCYPRARDMYISQRRVPKMLSNKSAGVCRATRSGQPSYSLRRQRRCAYL